jgi:hypothetical protein
MQSAKMTLVVCTGRLGKLDYRAAAKPKGDAMMFASIVWFRPEA